MPQDDANGQPPYPDTLIESMSCVPVHLELQDTEGLHLSNATAFFVRHAEQSFLVTNWHVVTGRDPMDRSLVLRCPPAKFRVWMHVEGRLGKWSRVSAPLEYAPGKPVWIEHPTDREADVIAIPFAAPAGHAIYDLDLGSADADVAISPSDPVSVVGFPYGYSPNVKFPIWKTGYIASEPDMKFLDKYDAFVIDATTRAGMSGSPVVAHRSGAYLTRRGPVTLGKATRFLGIYSGRIILREPRKPEETVELGLVWKPKVLKEILAQTS